MSDPKALPPPSQPLQPSWYGYDVEPPEQSAVPLAHYLWILRRHGWKIIAFVLACVTATLIISARLTPIYESTVTVDIDRQMPSAIIGQDAARSPMNDSDQFLATQVKLIQSDSVLRPVALQYHLLDLERDASDVNPEKTFRGRKRGSHPAQETQGHASTEHLFVADQLSIAATATGGGRSECRGALLCGTHLQHPL